MHATLKNKKTGRLSLTHTKTCRPHALRERIKRLSLCSAAEQQLVSIHVRSSRRSASHYWAGVFSITTTFRSCLPCSLLMRPAPRHYLCQASIAPSPSPSLRLVFLRRLRENEAESFAVPQTLQASKSASWEALQRPPQPGRNCSVIELCDNNTFFSLISYQRWIINTIIIMPSHQQRSTDTSTPLPPELTCSFRSFHTVLLRLLCLYFEFSMAHPPLCLCSVWKTGPFCESWVEGSEEYKFIWLAWGLWH